MTTTTATRSATPDTASSRLAPTVAAVLLASVLLPLAVTGPAVILPLLSADLHAGAAATQWIQNAFNATFAGFVLVGGSLADRLGRRRVLRISIGVFAGASLAITAAQNAVTVDVLRGVQGIGGAGILAAGAAVLAGATSGAARATVFGLLGAAFGGGLAVGPILAGALSMLGWRVVFGVIGVLAVVSFLLSGLIRREDGTRSGRIDVWGMASFASALLVLSFGFVSAGTAGWGTPLTITAFVATVVLLAVFVRVELRVPHAMFDVRLFRRPEFVAVMCQPLSVTFGFVVLLVFVPVYLQGVQGVSALHSAITLLPMTLPVLVVPLVVARFVGRLSVRAVLVVGSASIGVGLLSLVVLSPTASFGLLSVPLVVFGVGVGLAFTVMDNAAVSAVPVSKAGAAAGMFNTMRVSGESLAVASCGAVLATLIGTRVGPGATRAALAGQPATGAVGAAFTAALHVVFIALGVLAFVGAALTARALRPVADGNGPDTSRRT